MSTSHKPLRTESANPRDHFEETALKWGGLLMIFLAVAFAMGIAIDHGLFTPGLRVISGVLVGAALIGVGLFIYMPRPVFGQSLQGTGIAVIFMSLFAGHQVFDVINWESAIGATLVVTALSFWLAARRGDSALAAIGLLGGLAAPFALVADPAGGAGAASLDAYVTYAATLLLAAVAVYYFNGWGSLLVTSGVLAVATFGMVAVRIDGADSSRVLAQAGLTVVALALWLVPVTRLVVNRPVIVSRHSVDRAWSEFFRGAELGTVVWAPSAAIGATVAIWSLDGSAAGWLSFAAALVVGFLGVAVRRVYPTLGLTHFVAAATLLGAASMLLLEGPVLTVALGGQALAYLVVGRRADAPVLQVAGAVLAVPVLLGVVMQQLDAFGMVDRVAAPQLIAHLIIVAFVAVGAALEQDERARAIAAGAAYSMLALWLAELFVGVRNAPALTTAGWIVMSAAAAYVGLRLQSRPAIQAALATVIVAVSKMLTVDLAQVNAVGRTISFFVAGVVLVAFGYMYPEMRAVLRSAKPVEDRSDRRFIYADPPRPK